MSSYLYGFVRWPFAAPTTAGPRAARGTARGAGKAKAPRAADKGRGDAGDMAGANDAAVEALGPGVGDPPRPVYAVRHRNLAALVSDAAPEQMEDASTSQGLRAVRRDMKAHSAVLARAVELTTVLPVRFGVILPDDQTLVARVLAPQYAALEAALAQLEGAVELKFKSTYLEEQVLQEVVRERPELARRPAPARAGGRGYQARLDLGRQVAAAVQAKQAQDRQWLLKVLGPLARDVRADQPAADLTVLKASFLVDRAGLPAFDRTLAKVQAEAGHCMQLDCVGPLPPYSFVELSL